jgi:hypothetical protein
MPEQTSIDFTDRKAPMLTDDERRVWWAISDHAGKEEAILGARVADLAQVDYDTVRAIISHLVNFHGYLIASCSRGYYVPVTPEEIAAATRSLRHRGIMILRRAARLQNSSLEEVFHQGRLELEAG